MNADFDVEGMSVVEHLVEACRLLEGPDVSPEEWDEARRDNVGTAQAHATIAGVLLTYATGLGARHPRLAVTVTVADLVARGTDEEQAS